MPIDYMYLMHKILEGQSLEGYRNYATPFKKERLRVEFGGISFSSSENKTISKVLFHKNKRNAG